MISRIFTEDIIIFFLAFFVINSASAQEFVESPNLKVVMELMNSGEVIFTFKNGDVLKISGYVEENHGLTKVGNVLIDFFFEFPDGKRMIVLENFQTDENGDFTVTIPLSSDFVLGKYILTAEPKGIGYQKQLDSARQIIEFNLVESDGVWKSVLKQYRTGIPSDEINCKDDLILVIKSSTGSPACVKPDTKQKLIQRGWTL